MTIQDAALKSSRAIAWRISTVVSSLLVLLIFGVLTWNTYFRVDAAVSAISGQLSHLLIVGDTFELKTQLMSLSSGGLVDHFVLKEPSGIIVTGDGAKEGFQQNTGLVQSSHPQIRWFDGRLHLVRTFSVPVRSREPGILIVSKEIHFESFLIVIFVQAFLFVLINAILRRYVLGFAHDLTSPISKLAFTLKSANGYRELAGNDSLKGALRYEELNQTFESFLKLLQRFETEQELRRKAERDATLSEVAAQVAHDIVMPITALNQIISFNSNDSAHDRALIQEELEKVKALAEKMLRQYRGETQPSAKDQFDLVALVSTITIEAKAISKGRCEVIAELPGAKILVNGVKSDLSAAISNIVKNAIEAIEKPPGEVKISVSAVGPESVTVSVRDTGCGIPEENLSKIFERDVTFKPGGTGLGLYQAKTAIEAIGGKISVNSNVERGTTVVTTLPVHLTSSMFTVEIDNTAHLVFVDDDKLVHELWQKIVPPHIPSSRVHFFSSARSLYSWMARNKAARAVFFIDHDLSTVDGKNGLQLIEELGLHESAFLLTGRAREDRIRKTCQENGVRLLDKARQGMIQFRVSGSERLVLIDDARANRIAWTAQAKHLGRSLDTFASGEEFLKVESRFDRTTPVYVDYFFDGEPIGGGVAEQLIKAGFSKVFLATAYPKEKIVAPFGVRGIVGKDFPINPPDAQEVHRAPNSLDKSLDLVHRALPMHENQGGGAP